MSGIYARLSTRVLRGRDPIHKGTPVANNTRMYFREGGKYVDVVLHNTVIVRAYANGKTQVFTGGWRTPTTKERINRYTGLNIYQHKHVWYVPNRTGLFNNQPIEFEEGMCV